jgi:hypothetical protein
MEEQNMVTRFWVENLMEGEYLEAWILDGKMILKWILEMWVVRKRTSTVSGQGSIAGFEVTLMDLWFSNQKGMCWKVATSPECTENTM